MNEHYHRASYCFNAQYKHENRFNGVMVFFRKISAVDILFVDALHHTVRIM